LATANGLIGKKVLIIFEDGTDHFSRKEGTCTEASDVEVVVDGKHFIPRSRIIRIEVV
jgi:hypothetical protein